MRWIFFHGVFGDWGWEQVDDTGGVIAESRVCFESRDDAVVIADPQHLEQLLANLVVNALSYSSGPVVAVVEEGRLAIEDRGPGIPREVMSRLGGPRSPR